METQVFSGIVLMYFQSWLKRFDWYKKFVTTFPAADKYVHRAVAGLGSLIIALGITYTVTGDTAAGWHVVLNIPNANDLMIAAWNFVQVYVSQQVSYDMTRRPAAMPHDQPAAVAAEEKKVEKK